MKFARFKTTNLVILTALTVVVGIGLWFGWQVREFFRYQSDLAPQIQREFEFRHGSPYVNAGGSVREVFTIHPIDGGYLYQLGFREGDIVISESVTGFYKSLHKFKENERPVSVTVVDGGDGSALDKRNKRVLTFRVRKR